MNMPNSSARTQKGVLAAAIFGTLGVVTTCWATWTLVNYTFAGIELVTVIATLMGGLIGTLAAYQAFRYARKGEVWRMTKLRLLLVLFMVLYSTAIVLLVVA